MLSVIFFPPVKLNRAAVGCVATITEYDILRNQIAPYFISDTNMKEEEKEEKMSIC